MLDLVARVKLSLGLVESRATKLHKYRQNLAQSKPGHPSLHIQLVNLPSFSTPFQPAHRLWAQSHAVSLRNLVLLPLLSLLFLSVLSLLLFTWNSMQSKFILSPFLAQLIYCLCTFWWSKTSNSKIVTDDQFYSFEYPFFGLC